MAMLLIEQGIKQRLFGMEQPSTVKTDQHGESVQTEPEIIGIFVMLSSKRTLKRHLDLEASFICEVLVIFGGGGVLDWKLGSTCVCRGMGHMSDILLGLAGSEAHC